MKKLLTVLIFALLLSSCSKTGDGQGDTDNIIVTAPTDPAEITTRVPIVTDKPETTTAPISETKPVTTEPVTSDSKPATSAAQIVDPVPMTYRYQFKLENGSWLVDADYNLAFVEPEGNPVFHKTTTSMASGIRIIYCSDLNVSLLIGEDKNLLTTANGRLANPIGSHWLLYPSESGGNFKIFDISLGKAGEGEYRGFNDRPDGKLALLGGKEIAISDGKTITEERVFELIYYFTDTYVLVREEGRLRFYSTSFDLLADWSDISASNRIHFDETKRDGDSFEFFFDSGSFKYTPGQPIVSGAESVGELDTASGKLKLIKKDGKFYSMLNGKLTELELPDVDIILFNENGAFLNLLDDSYNPYCFGILKDGLAPMKMHAEVEQFGSFTAVNSNDYHMLSHLIDRDGKVIDSQNGYYCGLGSFVGGCDFYYGSVLCIFTPDGRRLDTVDVSLLSDGRLLAVTDKSYFILDTDGKEVYHSSNYDKAYCAEQENVLVLDKARLKLLNIDGSTAADFGVLGELIDLNSCNFVTYQSGYMTKPDSGEPTFYFTFEGNKDGKYSAFECCFEPNTGKIYHVNGVQVGTLEWEGEFTEGC